MLYHLTQLLVPTFSAFNVFQYLTLRAILSVLTALVICLTIGPAMIRRLTFYKIGQTVRTDGPQTARRWLVPPRVRRAIRQCR